MGTLKSPCLWLVMWKVHKLAQFLLVSDGSVLLLPDEGDDGYLGRVLLNADELASAPFNLTVPDLNLEESEVTPLALGKLKSRWVIALDVAQHKQVLQATQAANLDEQGDILV